MMKLINSTPSAFGRKVAIALKEKRIPYEMVFDVPWNDKTIVPQFSPLQQLPILVTDAGENVYDSMYICEWLERRYPSPPLLPSDTDGILAAKRQQILAERLMEVIVLVVFEEQREQPSPSWMTRQRRKFEGGIAELSRLVGNRVPKAGEPITYADIATVAALTWFDFMLKNGLFAQVTEARWRQKYPNLVAYVDALEARPSFRETSPEMFVVDLPAVVA
ncbi:MAG: Glutathione S-transferase domain protein [Panacagrimonas sp.]|jgi:glutathione S-transferase|nr:glutathione S-transferase N-terminal domain-containing protein [Panacagrimonas sp.]MCC2656384.1 Glutathione S-transferase domain protein [Panacagrimonas sp.]